MGRLVVASQLNAAFNGAFAQALPDVDILSVPAGPPAGLPHAAKVLIAAPFRKAGGSLPVAPPPGWPFDVKWVQLVSVGIDFYPPWLF
ncbi:MAG: dihydrofolate reductase, partial [Phenylobacterium sp.]